MILDTNALSAMAEGDERIGEALRRQHRIVLPVIVLGEFRYGIAQSRHKDQYVTWLTNTLPFLDVLAIQEDSAIHYGEICAELRKAGTPIPTNDIWIAALARQHALPILSRDRHFDAVTGVQRVSW